MTQTESATGRGALPVELTHFVGRERELSALQPLAGSARLLTLTGTGGSGKSRLALELVPLLPRDLEDTVSWVELAPLLEPHLIPGAVLRAFGSPAEGGAATAQSIIETIGGRAATLILDNCEHLVDACAALADALLRACPNLRIIATSREALGVAGERAWLVPPLALPDADAGPEALTGSDAVCLFVDRARDVLPDFTLTDSNARAVADICTRVDGIPLAIELAAARVRHLTPDQIRDRLSDAFALLTTGARTALPRHRTLRATLDWSHDLLPADARVVLRRLAVFRGGFTLDVVERVASGDGIEPASVLDLIGRLVDRSMIVVREQVGTARYQLLETMRQYAAQRLEESGEALSVRRRFADTVIRLVAEAEPSFTTKARRGAFALLEPELDNIREVLAWTREHDPEQHVRLVGMLWWFWFSTRHWVEAHRWITEALMLPAAMQPTHERAALLFAAGALAALRAQDEALTRLEEAAALAASLGNARLEAYAANYIAMTYAARLAPEAREHARRAEHWLRANGDAYGLRLSLLLGGMAEYGAGNADAAVAMMEEAVEIARSFGQDRELAVALQTYATILIGIGRDAQAQSMVSESLEALRRDPSFLFIARAIDYHAHCLAAHEPERAARELGIAATMRRHIGAARFQHDEVTIARLIARLRDVLGDAAYERAFADGQQVRPSESIDEVLGAGTAESTQGGTLESTHVTGAVTPALAVVSTVAASPAAALAPTVPASPAAALAPTVVVPPAVALAPTVAADLRVRALGPFEVHVHGRRIDDWPYARPKELLALLLLHPHGCTRVEIGDALWPDAAPSQVRNSFHVTMHHVRKALGHADWIARDGERYAISPDITVEYDVMLFQHQVQAALAMNGEPAIAALRAAIQLYRDHFMADESAGPWRDDVQDRLRRQFCDAGLKLGTLLDAAGDLDGAAAAYEAVAKREPLHETAHRGLLRTFARSGRRVHAMRHYERLTALLQSLELEPEEETIALYERIRNAEVLPDGRIPAT